MIAVIGFGIDYSTSSTTSTSGGGSSLQFGTPQ